MLIAQDILDELDEDASSDAGFFPDFDHGYYYHVDARLSAYGDKSRWALLIEQLAVNPRSGCFGGVSCNIYYHGNGVVLPPQEGWGDQAVKTVTTVEQGPEAPLLEEDYSDTINPAATHVRLRGQAIPIRTDENFYWARAINVPKLTHNQIDEWIANARKCLTDDVLEHTIQSYEGMREKVGKFELRTWHLMRSLVPEHRDLLMATEDERREGVPDDVPLLLQLDDWDHPHLLDDERPSTCESFKMIAKVLASGDPKQYQPTEEGNLHWKNWPNSGSL